MAFRLGHLGTDSTSRMACPDFCLLGPVHFVWFPPGQAMAPAGSLPGRSGGGGGGGVGVCGFADGYS